MILGLALAIAAAAVFAYGVALELSVNAFYTGVVVLWFVAPPLASLAAAAFVFSSSKDQRLAPRVGVSVLAALGTIVGGFVVGLIPTVLIYSHS
jgi:hypothetical protein